MKAAEGSNPYPILLLGAVRGSLAEATKVVADLERFAPDRLALGLSPEEVQALQEHFADPYQEPWVPLASIELAYARGIARFGPARVPSPSFLASLRWARARGLPVDGIEPGDEAYGSLFVDHVGFFDLVRRTRAERSLGKRPPEEENAEAFALAWETRAQVGGGSHALLKVRAEHVAKGLRHLCTSRMPSGGARPSSASLKNRVALVADVERFRLLLETTAQQLGEDLRERGRSGGGPTSGGSAPLRSGP